MKSGFVRRQLIRTSFVLSILKMVTLTKARCGTITLPNGDIVALKTKSVTNEDVFGPEMRRINAKSLLCKLPYCLSNPCQNGGTCTETLDDITCTCSTGFNGPTCAIDVDECDVHLNSCDTNNGVCTNMPGTFNCSCTAGYELDVDGRTCNDVDECDVHLDSCDTTNGVCTNMPGTFNCSCTTGYDLDVDRRTCNDVDECDVHSDSCDTINGVCTNMPGTFSCSCIAGYDLTKCPDASWTSFQGSCYKFFYNDSSFPEAMSTCRSLTNEQSCHADLVSIHSAEERAFIVSLYNGPLASWCWIGLNRADPLSPFLWSDGTPVEYTSWQSREPDGVGNCVASYTHTNVWNDVPCNSVYRYIYICKVPAVCQDAGP